MLGNNDLSYMREALELLMPDTCTILSKTVTVDSSGGVIETWATAYSNVACRVDFTSGMMPLSGGAVQPFTKLEIHVPYDTVINADNEIVWDGVTYRIEPASLQSWQTEKVAVIHAV